MANAANKIRNYEMSLTAAALLVSGVNESGLYTLIFIPPLVS